MSITGISITGVFRCVEPGSRLTYNTFALWGAQVHKDYLSSLVSPNFLQENASRMLKQGDTYWLKGPVSIITPTKTSWLKELVSIILSPGTSRMFYAAGLGIFAGYCAFKMGKTKDKEEVIQVPDIAAGFALSQLHTIALKVATSFLIYVVASVCPPAIRSRVLTVIPYQIPYTILTQGASMLVKELLYSKLKLIPTGISSSACILGNVLEFVTLFRTLCDSGHGKKISCERRTQRKTQRLQRSILQHPPFLKSRNCVRRHSSCHSCGVQTA